MSSRVLALAELPLVGSARAPFAVGVRDLVARAAAGDRAAFEAIYREHVGRVFALCLRLAGDRSRAEEYTQDVFVRAWDRLSTFRGEAAFSSWLHRLAVNVVFQDRRAEQRRLRRVGPAGEQAEHAPAPARDPAGRMDLERAIAALPEGARRVFVLHDIEGYGHAEIASLLGIATGTSKAHLHRARRQLREALDR